SAVIGWRGLFALPLVLAVTGLAVGFRGLDRSAPPTTGRINVLAAVLLSGWLVALLLPLSSGNQWGWGSPLVIGLFTIAPVLAAPWGGGGGGPRNPPAARG